MRPFLFAALLAIPAFASAQPATPETVEVQLSSFAFAPNAIRLHAGRPVTLHLVNAGSGGHNFSAPEFFAAASGVSSAVTHGTIEVPGHQSVDVTLTPAAGSYHLKCTHTLHSSFGMHGEIVVE